MSVRQLATYVGLAAVGLFAITTATGSFYTVNQTERGVLLRNGAFVEVVQPGLHFKWPWVEDYKRIDVQTHNKAYDQMEAYSADTQPAHMRVSVTYHVALEKIGDLYARFSGDPDAAVDKLVRPHIYAGVKTVFGKYPASKAITDRGQLNTDVTHEVSKAIDYDPVIVVESMQIENVEFSKEYIKNIEARMAAEVEVQRLEQNLKRTRVEAEITVTKANAEADAVRANARAEADKVKLRGEADATAIAVKGKAEAEAITAKGVALSNNPQIVAYTTAANWNGHLPTTMVPGGAVPMLNIIGK